MQRKDIVQLLLFDFRVYLKMKDFVRDIIDNRKYKTAIDKEQLK